MEDIVYKIFDTSMFSNILFVDDNPAVVKSITIEKIGGEINKTQTETIYSLDKNKNDNLSYNLLSKFNSNKEIKYFNRNIIKKIFKRQDCDYLIKEIINYDWIITNDKIIKEFEKSADFEILDSKTEIKLVGKIKNTFIYRNPIGDIDCIYLGNKESITPVFKKDSKFEYTYHINGNLTKLIIS